MLTLADMLADSILLADSDRERLRDMLILWNFERLTLADIDPLADLLRLPTLLAESERDALLHMLTL